MTPISAAIAKSTIAAVIDHLPPTYIQHSFGDFLRYISADRTEDGSNSKVFPSDVVIHQVYSRKLIIAAVSYDRRTVTAAYRRQPSKRPIAGPTTCLPCTIHLTFETFTTSTTPPHQCFTTLQASRRSRILHLTSNCCMDFVDTYLDRLS
jgi:hypothetical protein